MTLLEGDEVDDLDLGRPPREPLPRRRKRPLVAGAAVVAAAVGVVLLVVPQHHAAPAREVSTPSADGFAAGPVLVRGDGLDQLTVPGGAMFGGAAMNVALAPADDAVAAVRSHLPSFTDVHGGRVANPEIHYGIYLQGTFTTADGHPASLVVYTARAPETQASADISVTRVRVDGAMRVRTDASVYTGTGWWLHGVADASAADQTAALRAVLMDSRLVS